MDQPVCQLERLCKKVGGSGREGLGPLDLTLGPGETVSIVGMKLNERRTLIDLLSGVTLPDAGNVRFMGINLAPADETLLNDLRGRMGFATDPPVFLNNVRIMENLRLPLRYHSSMDTPSIDALLTDLFRALDLEDFTDQIPSHFYPRFLRAAALLRALSVSPDLLVVERPLEQLGDPLARRLPEIWKKRVTAHGGAVLVLTDHDRLARAVTDRVTRFENGQVTLDAGK